MGTMDGLEEVGSPLLMGRVMVWILQELVKTSRVECMVVRVGSM